MFRTLGIIALAAATLTLLGCGKSMKTGGTTQDLDTGAASDGGVGRDIVNSADPASAVSEFLEAVRSGNDSKAARMLSQIAREKTASLNRSVTPPASDTAKFAIGKVEYVGEDGARVGSTWTDLDADGQPRTDEAIWVVRREPEGWRIAGVAAIVFPNEPPLVLNFEDPEDMFRKQQWVREEIERRAEKEQAASQAHGRTADASNGHPSLQAKGQKKSESPVRR
jgi:hypothetical protein